MEFLQTFDPNVIPWLLVYAFLGFLTWRTTKLQPIVLYMRDVENSDEVDFTTLPTASSVEETGNTCIWCGKAYPKPIDDENPETAWYEAQKSWVMLSYGSGDVTKVACCDQHMEQYIMCGKPGTILADLLDGQSS